jgi:hypothetical protein
MSHVKAIDAVVNIWTPEALAGRPNRAAFYTEKMRVDSKTFAGMSLTDMLAQMDKAGIERARSVSDDDAYKARVPHIGIRAPKPRNGD